MAVEEIGQQVAVNIDALGDLDLTGEVSKLIPAGDSRTHTFLVEIDLPALHLLGQVLGPDQVGRLLGTIGELGLGDDTIVIFASDNGGIGWPDDGGDIPMTSNLPMRGWKGTLMEGGVRVPMIIRWPGLTSPGTLSSVPVHLVDLLPTLLELAGADYPSSVGGSPTPALDGRSLVPLLGGETPDDWRESIYYHS